MYSLKYTIHCLQLASTPPQRYVYTLGVRGLLTLLSLALLAALLNPAPTPPTPHPSLPPSTFPSVMNSSGRSLCLCNALLRSALL